MPTSQLLAAGQLVPWAAETSAVQPEAGLQESAVQGFPSSHSKFKMALQWPAELQVLLMVQALLSSQGVFTAKGVPGMHKTPAGN